MRIKSEKDLLDAEVRKKIITEINSTENKARKEKFYKFYQCYKDNTREYVLRHIKKQFDADTVNEMSYAVTNLGFTRKAVDKLARVYNYGVERDAMVNDQTDEKLTEAITLVTKECDVNRIFKKTNRWLKRDKNCVQFIVPRKISFETNDEKFTIKPAVLPAFLYDAVELEDNREIAGCYILSDFSPQKKANQFYISNGGDASVRMKQMDAEGNYAYTDGVDNTIADSPKDQKTFDGHYIFWSDNYHFTCDEKGQIIPDPDNPNSENPIGMKPFVNYAEDQDNAFWALGGDDLVDGSISINSMITNIIHIAITQGYGQAVVSGSKPPRALKLGPNKVILLEQANIDEPKPEFKFETANPPLDELRQLVEFYVALLLTTNNLSTSGVSTTLNGTSTFPSGIAMMIDKAESMEDIEDQRQIFIDNEPHFWNIFAKWHTYLKVAGDLDDCLMSVDFPKDEFDVALKFGKAIHIVTESEKLDVLKKKKDLGLISKIDMMKSEYPDMTDEQLKDKIAEIVEEATKAIADAQAIMGTEQPVELDENGKPMPPKVMPSKAAPPADAPPADAPKEKPLIPEKK